MARETTTNDPPHFEELVARGVIHLFGYEEGRIPDELAQKESGRVVIFRKSGKKRKDTSVAATKSQSYHGAIDIQRSAADVCFLEHEALLALAVKFPMHPTYVVVRIAPRGAWILGFVGLAIRLLKKDIKLRGLKRFEAGGRKQTWLVLARDGEHHGATEFLSSEVGVQGFLKFLNDEKVRYVVLRSYKHLPDLPKEKDLDVLIADEDEAKVRAFIHERPGNIPIDIASVSFSAGGVIPLYPPPLARKILESAREGPGGSRVPGKEEDFLALAYHALYHKGSVAGIPSSMPWIIADKNPKNDYVGILTSMARGLHLDVKITMEDLDEYLAEKGWRPMRDTLAIIAKENAWVSKRFFFENPSRETGLGVIILRRSPDRTDVMDAILTAIEKEKFVILRKKRLNKKEQDRAARHLRGGNWAERENLNKGGAFLPIAAFVIMDLHLVYSKNREGGPGEYSRIRQLKDNLRSRFAKGGVPLLHSTDTTSEAWDYIEVCFLEEKIEIRREVTALRESFRLSSSEKMALYAQAAPYLLKRKILTARNAITRWIEKRL